jgi:hypothetical protein
MAWITAPLNAGPIPGTTYNYTIPGLSANTIYEYRAYMIVGGVEYYGQTYEINTLPPTQVPPTVHTGTPTIISPYEVQVIGNQVASGGTKPMLARGIVWSTSPNPTIPTLQGVIEQPPNMIGYYDMTMSSEDFPSLDPNTTYYIRAVAESGNQNVGYFTAYGEECTVTTPPIPIAPMDVCLFRTFTNAQNSATGCICTNPLLAPSESLTMNISMEQLVNTNNGYGGIAELFCKTNAYPYFVLVMSLTTTYSEFHKTIYKSIPMNVGDCICWQQSITADSWDGSFSRIQIANISSWTPNILPHIDPTYYWDWVNTQSY